jgi:predicted permease
MRPEHWLYTIPLRLRSLFRWAQADQELDEELRDHIERKADEYAAQGMTQEQAHRRARLDLEGFEQTKEKCRDARRVSWIENFAQDSHFGLRILRKSPGFTAVVILTLALGIGANTAIFQLVDSVRLRSMPVPNPQELVEVRVANGNGGMGINVGDNPQMTNPLWEELRGHQVAFSGIFAWGTDYFSLGNGANARNIHGLWVSGGFFPVLGIAPAHGRLLDYQDDRHGCGASVAVISYGLWQSEFAGRDSAVGSSVTVQDHSFQIVGVTPPGFWGLDVGRTFDVALPICSLETIQSVNASFHRRDVWWLTVMGRLKAGWTPDRASAYLGGISRGLLEATVPMGYQSSTLEKYLNFRMAAYPAGNGMSPLRQRFDTPLWILLCITGLVLLIACANLANLMLARANARQREMATRLALGASRGRLIQQLLSESLLLVLSGTLLGVALARWLAQSILRLLSTEGNVVQLDLSLDWRVLAFTAAGAVLTCVLFGLVPAFRSSQADPGVAVKVAGRAVTAGRDRFSFQRFLVLSQVAISLILVTSALLFVRSFRNLMAFNPGFREQDILLVQADFRRLLPRPLKPLQRDLLNQIRAVPQVESAAMSTHVPLDGSSWTLGFNLDDVRVSSKFTWVTAQYFETMQIPVLSGRDFTDRDTESSPRVALVNQTFVRDYCGERNPIGKTITTVAEPHYPAATYEIVGVVRDTKYAGLREPIPPQVFGAAQQYPTEGPWGPIFIRSSAPMSTIIAAVKDTLGRTYPAMKIEFQVFQTQIRDRLVIERLMAALSGFFGILAGGLAILGLYGVMSYIVIQRRNEIGIRVALGAKRSQVISMVMLEAGTLLLIGAVIGASMSLAAGRAAGSLLFGLSSSDPLTLALAIALLVVCGAVASFLPAYRASNTDPMVALRYE